MAYGLDQPLGLAPSLDPHSEDPTNEQLDPNRTSTISLSGRAAPSAVASTSAGAGPSKPRSTTSNTGNRLSKRSRVPGPMSPPPPQPTVIESSSFWPGSPSSSVSPSINKLQKQNNSKRASSGGFSSFFASGSSSFPSLSLSSSHPISLSSRNNNSNNRDSRTHLHSPFHRLTASSSAADNNPNRDELRHILDPTFYPSLNSTDSRARSSRRIASSPSHLLDSDENDDSDTETRRRRRRAGGAGGVDRFRPYTDSSGQMHDPSFRMFDTQMAPHALKARAKAQREARKRRERESMDSGLGLIMGMPGDESGRPERVIPGYGPVASSSVSLYASPSLTRNGKSRATTHPIQQHRHNPSTGTAGASSYNSTNPLLSSQFHDEPESHDYEQNRDEEDRANDSAGYDSEAGLSEREMLPPEMIIHEEVTEEPIPANAPIVVVEPASASGGGADMPRIVNIASSAGGARTDSGYAGSLSPRIGLGPSAGIGQHSSTSSAPLLRNSVVSASVPASVSISEEGDVYVDAVEEHNHDGAAPDSQFPPTGITRPTPVRRNSQQQQHQQRFLYDVPISPYPASPRRQSASTTASSIRPASQRTTATAATGARRASASSASLPYRPQPHRELSRSTLYPRPVANTSFAPHSRAGSGTASPARRSVSGRGMGIGTTAMGMRTGSPYRRGSGRYTIEHDDDDDSSAMSARSRSVVSDDDDVEEGQEVEFAVPLGAGSRLSLGLPPSSSSHHVRSRPRTPLPPTTATASISASGSVSAASSAVMPPPRLGMTSVVSIPDGGPEFWYGVLPEDDPDSPFRPVVVRPVGDDATGRSHDKHASRGGGETEGEKKKTKKAKLTKKKKKDVHEVDDDDNDVQNNNDDEVEPTAVNPIIAALSSRPNTRPSSPAPSVHSFRPGTPNSKRASRTAAPLPESAAARGYTHSHGASVSPFQPAYTTPYKKRDPNAEEDDDDEESEKVKSQFFDASIVRDPEKWRAAGLDQLEVEGPIGPHRGTRNRDEARERREKAREAREALRRDLLRREPEYVNEKADPAPLHATTAQEDLEMFAGAGAVREKSPAASIRTTSNHNVRRRPNAPPSSLGASDAQPPVVGKGYIPSHHGKSTSLRPGVHVIESEDYAPGCMDGVRRSWQAFKLSLRFSAFRTRRRIERAMH